VSAAAIARSLGMSERAFRRWFRADIGTTFTSWHQQQLVERASVRLQHGDSVKAIAVDLGYSSTSAFITLFKRLTGTTPQRHARRAN
jgi:AraC-like DNA-binding protein